MNTSTLTLSGNSTVENNSGVGGKFNLPSGSAPAVSSMAYSSVSSSNGDWGVYIGVGSTFSSSLYPHGEHNNIAGNAAFVNSTVGNAGQLYEPWVQESDDWQYDYFYTGATNANCSLDPNPAQNFVATSVPDPGVVSATLYTGTGNPPPHCYANNVDTRNTLSSPAW